MEPIARGTCGWSGWCRAVALTAALVATGGAAFAQQPAGDSPPNEAIPTPTPTVALAPADISGRVLAGQRLVRELRPVAVAADDVAAAERETEEALAVVEQLVRGLEEDTAHTKSRRVLEDLRAQAVQIRDRVRSRQDDIGTRSVRVGEAIGRVSTELTTWRATRSESWFGSLPEVLSGQIQRVETDLEALQIDLEDRLGTLLEAQSLTSQVETHLDQLFEDLDAEFAARARDMFALDATPLWRFLSEPQHLDGLGRQIVEATGASLASVRSYLEKDRGAIGVQLFAWMVLVVLLERSRRRVHGGARVNDPRPALAVLRRPAAAALLLVVTVGQVLLNRDAPSAWQDLVRLLILVGAARLLPVLMRPRMRRVLRGLAVIAVLHWMAYLVSERLPIDRLLWLAASLAGALALPRLGAWTVAAIGDDRPRLAAAAGLLARITAVALAVATVANVAGAFTLASEITNGALVSAYLFVLMWTLTEIVDGLLLLLLGSSLGRRLRIVRDDGARVRVTVGRIAGFLAVAGWAAGTLAEIGVLSPGLRVVRAALAASMTVGQVTVSAGTVLLFGLVLWMSYQISHLVRFVLHEEVFSRVELPQGVPVALSTLTHYVLIVIGFLVAVAAVGLDLTNFALVVGALGVGIGFGLQAVVNNFVSGLILLFERPIRVGDKVQIGTMSGAVTEIGIRASTVRTWEGAEVVIPNGSLLESELVNWTLSDATRRVEVRVGVAYGTDPERVLALLAAAVAAHPKVLAEPAPMAIFVGFGDSSLDFVARAWCEFDDMVGVASDLHVAVNRCLVDAGIEIPFPQRDVHLKAVPPGLFRQPRETP